LFDYRIASWDWFHQTLLAKQKYIGPQSLAKKNHHSISLTGHKFKAQNCELFVKCCLLFTQFVHWKKLIILCMWKSLEKFWWSRLLGSWVSSTCLNPHEKTGDPKKQGRLQVRKYAPDRSSQLKCMFAIYWIGPGSFKSNSNLYSNP